MPEPNYITPTKPTTTAQSNPSPVTVMGDGTALIKLNGKNAAGRVAIIDEQDADLVRGFAWVCDKRGYAVTTINVRRILRLHRFILGLKPGDPGLDHEEGDKLNNRRNNLRRATQAQNSRNRGKSTTRNFCSQYKGVTFLGGERRDRSPNLSRWQASICLNYNHIYIGVFATEEAAARAYDAKARELFAEFARLNFPD
jgi:hypothetical protein